MERSTRADTAASRIERVRGGDTEAFNALVREYGPTVTQSIKTVIQNPDDVEELAQDVWLKCFDKIGQFDASRASFCTWLAQIGKYAALDHLRKRKRRISTVNLPDKHDGLEDRPFDPVHPIDDVASREYREEVARVLEDGSLQTKAEYATVLRMHYLEELSTSEIGALLGRNEVTIRWRIAEGRKLFKAAWERRNQMSRSVVTPLQASASANESEGMASDTSLAM